MGWLKTIKSVICCLLLVTLLSGCALVIQKGRRSDLDKIESLKEEISEFQRAKDLLERKFAREIEDNQVKFEMQAKGLVITVLAEVLFDSGKDVLREQSHPILNKLSSILNDRGVRENNVGIEGHTDDQPIKHSGWGSNWELASHRALSVLYYLEGKKVSADRLTAISYGEHRPVASNATEEGKQLNRRVEIVILPRMVKEVGSGFGQAEKEEILK